MHQSESEAGLAFEFDWNSNPPIKAVSDTVLDMIATTYHDKPLIFSIKY